MTHSDNVKSLTVTITCKGILDVRGTKPLRKVEEKKLWTY